MNSSSVQRVRDAIPGGELVVAGSRVRAGLDAAVNFDGICGVLALGAAEGDRGARGDPGSHHAIGTRAADRSRAPRGERSFILRPTAHAMYNHQTTAGSRWPAVGGCSLRVDRSRGAVRERPAPRAWSWSRLARRPPARRDAGAADRGGWAWECVAVRVRSSWSTPPALLPGAAV